MKFVIKVVLLLIILIVVSQLEYKGRKIQTYIEEYFRSIGTPKHVTEVKEEEKKEPEPKKTTVTPTPKKAKELDIGDKDRKELQNLLEQ